VKRQVARTSAEPGKTRLANVYRVQRGSMPPRYLVDLPGYGYARVPREMQASWRPMMETYLQQRHTLRAVVHIVDLRHPPTLQDQQLRAWLLHHDITIVTVATKADQVTRGQHAAHIQVIRQELALPPEEAVLLFSAQNHEGRLQLWGCLGAFLTPIVHTQRVASP